MKATWKLKINEDEFPFSHCTKREMENTGT